MSKRKYPVDRWSATAVAKNRLAAAVRDPWDQQDPWEVQPEAGAGAEAEGGETDDASDEDAPLLDFMKPIPPEVAGRELSDYLLSLKHKAVISAEVCCVIAYYAHAAGAAGLEDLAYPPSSQSGKFQEHLDNMLKFGDAEMEFYKVVVPSSSRHTAFRSYDPIYMLPPHEAVQRMLVEVPDMATRVQEAHRADMLPPYYDEHPVVRSAGPGEVIIPLALYVDGVGHTRTDGTVAYYLYNLIDNRRHLIAALRKEDMCRCGCGGHCTQFIAQRVIRWGFEAAAVGRFPASRHNGEAFEDCDAIRSSLAGAPLGTENCSRAAVVAFKCDLAELSSTFGLPAVSSNFGACPLCMHEGKDFFTVTGFTPFRMPARRKTFADWDQACSQCEINVSVTWEQFQVLRPKLRAHRRPNGPRGLALLEDVPLHGLCRGDRLEPTFDMENTYVCYTWTADTFPGTPRYSLRFWRRSAETHARRRSPLFADHLGTAPCDILAVDYLHALSKGVFQYWGASFFKAFFSCDAMRTGARAYSEKKELSVMLLRARLWAWYKEERQAGIPHTELQQLVPSFFGSQKKPTMDLHASETNHFIRFAKVVFTEHGTGMPHAAQWRIGVDSLNTILDVIHSAGYANPSAGETQLYCDAAVAFIKSCRALGLKSRPKHHMLLELGARPLLIYDN